MRETAAAELRADRIDTRPGILGIAFTRSRLLSGLSHWVAGVEVRFVYAAVSHVNSTPRAAGKVVTVPIILSGSFVTAVRGERKIDLGLLTEIWNSANNLLLEE